VSAFKSTFRRRNDVMPKRHYPTPCTRDGIFIVNGLIERWNRVNGQPTESRSPEAVEFSNRSYWESLQVIEIIRNAHPDGLAIPEPRPPRRPPWWKRVFARKKKSSKQRIENDGGIASPRNRERLKIQDALAAKWNIENGRPIGQRSKEACEWANQKYWRAWDVLDSARSLNKNGLLIQDDEES
jgi:hypothetical protein